MLPVYFFISLEPTSLNVYFSALEFYNYQFHFIQITSYHAFSSEFIHTNQKYLPPLISADSKRKLGCEEFPAICVIPGVSINSVFI